MKAISKNILLFFRIFKEISYMLSSKQKNRMIGVFFVIVMSSFFELLGVTVILPFAQAIIAPNDIMNNRYISVLCRMMGLYDSKSVTILIGIGIIIVFIIKNAFLIYSGYIQSSYASSIQKKMSVDVLVSYMKRPYTYYLDSNSANIKIMCTSGAYSARCVIEDIMGLITELFTVTLIGIYLICSDWQIAMCSLLIMGVVLLVVIMGFKPRIKQVGNISKKCSIERHKAVDQVAEGIKAIRVNRRESWFANEFSKAAEGYRKSNLTYSALNNCPNRIIEGICVSGIIGVICLRIYSGSDSMTLFVPKLASFAVALFKILPSVGKISGRINNIVFNRPLQEEIYKGYVELNNNDKLSAKDENHIVPKQSISDEVTKYADCFFSIRFNDVWWRYNNQELPVLYDMNMTIHKGEAIGLIGASGAGKTTVADILLGLLRPQSGTVLLDEKNIFEIPDIWSRLVGYVPQSVYLIDDTVRTNVLFGLEDVTDDDVWDALERSQIREFIESLPEGLDSPVGEKGVKLSGGQRQRIAIARALVSKPQVLVLDEATSALDNDTESALMESIEELIGSITLVIVAHRLTTIRKCDRVYEIVDGKAVERKTEELL